jgi:c-di-GMP-binding flagellar brake protein YcgR
MKKAYKGQERRKFVRLDYVTPLAFKVCKKDTVSQLLEGYTCDISEGGIRFNIKEGVQKNNIIWLSFDRSILDICREIENRCLIYQNGILGKVVWAQRRSEHVYDVGVQFLTREEKNLTHIYPKAYFLAQYGKQKK